MRVTNGGCEAWRADLEHVSGTPLTVIWNDIGHVCVDKGGTVRALGEAGGRKLKGLDVPKRLFSLSQDKITSARWI